MRQRCRRRLRPVVDHVTMVVGPSGLRLRKIRTGRLLETQTRFAVAPDLPPLEGTVRRGCSACNATDEWCQHLKTHETKAYLVSRKQRISAFLVFFLHRYYLYLNA